ncbi:MAG: HAMP domain-containing sensor histidine kinase [Dehalococcoidia bacterium]
MSSLTDGGPANLSEPLQRALSWLAFQLPLAQWPGLVLPQLEWGSVTARLVFACGLLAIPFLVPDLASVRPAALAAAFVLVLVQPLIAMLLIRRKTVAAMFLGTASDTLAIVGLVVWGGWLLRDSAVGMAPGAALMWAGVPLIVLVISVVIRLRPVPGAAYAVSVPLLIGVWAWASGVATGGVSSIWPGVVAMSGSGLAAIAVAFPIQLMRQQLERAIAEKVELISIVAHELRGPLTSTRAYVELLMDGSAGRMSGQQISLLRRASRSTLRMEHLISLFRDVERAESNEAPLKKERTSLAVVVREIADAFEPIASDRELHIDVVDVDDLPEAWGERQSVEQVLTNLVSNAIKFSPDGRTVTIAGYRIGSRVGLQVTDRGMGMSEDDQRHVFERFYRSNDPRKRRVRGTGLGLYVSKLLLERQDGRLWFTSAEGRGSTFGFSLAVAENDKAISEPDLRLVERDGSSAA